MILVDTALAERARSGNPVRVAMVGAGHVAQNITDQIIKSVPGMRLVAISNRTVAAARSTYASTGVTDVCTVESRASLEQAIRDGRYAVTGDPALVCEAEGIDAIIEATGTIEFAAGVVKRALQNGKHAILMNMELDSTLGPILKTYADRAGVVYSNSDGDEPAVAMNLIRYVRSIGLKPVVAGNLKGLYDRYRNPETQREFAEKYKQKPSTVASFADGTKLSMELTVLANASGFGVARRGMYGPALSHVNESAKFFLDKTIEGGMVDFLVGAPPAFGAFVLGYSKDAVKASFLKYFKMGDGPLYCFYTPFHLPPFEIPLTVARAALFQDAAVTPLGAPVCDALAFAKRDLKSGEILDGLGGFASYALIENYQVGRQAKGLPMGVSEGCRLKKDVPKDQLITYDDIELPPGRLCDRLRQEQHEHFSSSHRAR